MLCVFLCGPLIRCVYPDVCILQTEIEAIRDDIAPTWLQHPLSLEQTADKYVRPSLQQVNSAVSLASHCKAVWLPLSSVVRNASADTQPLVLLPPFVFLQLCI